MTQARARCQTVRCFFTSDLHGRLPKYQNLVNAILDEAPDAVFLGGDLLPGFFQQQCSQDRCVSDFVNDYLVPTFRDLKHRMGEGYPDVFAILGNDDCRLEEPLFLEARDVWHYMHMTCLGWRSYEVFGYAMVPPTPFLNKDWERYDVSRYVDPGCVSPTDGYRSVVPSERVEFATIQRDLNTLVGDASVEHAIFLMHAPPYNTALDRAALDGRFVDYVPLDVHVGSIAVQRFIADRQPRLTLHGHVHESTAITGKWKQRLGRTWSYNGAHNGPELSLIRFSPSCPGEATRELIP